MAKGAYRVVTVAALRKFLAGKNGRMEVRIDPDPDMTDQTEEEFFAYRHPLVDEDGRRFWALKVRNS